MNAYDLSRAQASRYLLSHMTELMNQYPTLRFSQLLDCFGFVLRDDVHPGYWINEFYTEPGVVLARVEAQMKKIAEAMKP